MSDPVETARQTTYAAVVAGLRLPFCAMNAAGSAANVAEVRALRHSIAGAIVLKTTTVHPFVHPGFRSLHNPGFDKLVPLVRELVVVETRPIVVSIAGNTPAELGLLGKTFADAGAGAIEVNFADPWVEATLAPFESEEALTAALAALSVTGRVPCWVKLPERPTLPYERIVDLLLDAGIRGVVAPNDFAGFEKLLVEAPRPIDVIVVGGIASGFDVLRALQKGAKAVQVGSALRSEGPGVFARLEREMRKAAPGGPA